MRHQRLLLSTMMVKGIWKYKIESDDTGWEMV